MKITNNTEKLLKCFIDDDGKYKLIKTNNNKEVGKLYKTFYKSINESFLEANVLQNMGHLSHRWAQRVPLLDCKQISSSGIINPRIF